MLEEFSDSLTSLNWENIYAKKIEFKTAVEESSVAEHSDQNEAANDGDNESDVGACDKERLEDEIAIADDATSIFEIAVADDLGGVEEITAAEAEDDAAPVSITSI